MIVTPLDSAELDSKEQYVFYHKMVDAALNQLVKKIEEHTICTAIELTFLKQYCNLLLYTIEAMRVKYMYNNEDNMKVDLTDSGFPNYLEFRYLFNDLELRDQYIQKLPNIAKLKTQFLDTLLRKKEAVKQRELLQAASIAYYTSVQKQYIFNRFVQGKIVNVQNHSDYNFITSWSFYDVSHNRPFICFMYFNYSGKKIEDYKQSIYQVLKQTADREQNLDAMAYTIDKKLERIQPKLFKRVDLGPLHNIFAKDENELTHAVLEGIGKKEIPLESYAISLKIDETKSKSQFKEGSIFNKQTLQKWGNIYKQKYVFAPHRVIQLLYNKTPNLMNTLAKAPIEVKPIH